MQADRAQPLRCSPCRHSSHPHQSAAAAFPPAIAAPAPTSRCPLCPTHGTKGSVVSSCRHPPSPPVSLPASPSHLRAHPVVAHASGTPSPRQAPPLSAASPQTCLSSLNILFFYITFAPTSALVAKLVDAPDLGSGVARRVGSSPIRRTPGRRSIPQWLLRRPYFFRHRTSSRAYLRKAHRITPTIKAAIIGFTPTLQPLRNPIVLCLSTPKKTMDKSTRFAALVPILHSPCGF